MSILPISQKNTWDITDKDGKTLVTFTAFIAIEFKAESKTFEHPTEEGGFFGYNKVTIPSECYVTLALQGTSETLQSSITTLLELKNNTTIISIETPYQIITSTTITNVDYSIKVEDGLNLLTVNLSLKEIRQVKPQYTNVSVPPIPKEQATNPADASTQDGGEQQPKEINKSTLTKIKEGILG